MLEDPRVPHQLILVSRAAQTSSDWLWFQTMPAGHLPRQQKQVRKNVRTSALLSLSCSAARHCSEQHTLQEQRAGGRGHLGLVVSEDSATGWLTPRSWPTVRHTSWQKDVWRKSAQFIRKHGGRGEYMCALCSPGTKHGPQRHSSQ